MCYATGGPSGRNAAGSASRFMSHGWRRSGQPLYVQMLRDLAHHTQFWTLKRPRKKAPIFQIYVIKSILFAILGFYPETRWPGRKEVEEPCVRQGDASRRHGLRGAPRPALPMLRRVGPARATWSRRRPVTGVARGRRVTCLHGRKGSDRGRAAPSEVTPNTVAIRIHTCHSLKKVISGNYILAHSHAPLEQAYRRSESCHPEHLQEPFRILTPFYCILCWSKMTN